MTVTAPNLTESGAKFRIGEREPLFWLVSVLFTEKFWQRDNLTRAILGLYGFGNADDIQPAEYSDWESLYRAVEGWVLGDPTAAACLERAKQAIETGELSYYAPEPDEWGVRPY